MWLQNGLGITDQLDRENKRTTYVVPDATFSERLSLHLGNREVQFIHMDKSHTAGDVIMWLPQEKIVATGDIVTAPIPLMPSPYTTTYVRVLDAIEALDFATLVPGHGAVQHDPAYVGLLRDLIGTAVEQMKAQLAKGAPKDEAVGKVDLSAIEQRLTHGNPFLINRFRDYVGSALPEAVYLMETGKGIDEQF